jgi:hypothetical protein
MRKTPSVVKAKSEPSAPVRLQDFFPEGTPGATFDEQLKAFLPREIETIHTRYVYREDDPDKVSKDVHTVAWKWKDVWDRCIWFNAERSRRGTYYNCDRDAFDRLEDLYFETDAQMKQAVAFMSELQKDAKALAWKFEMPKAEDTGNIQPGCRYNKLVLMQVPNGRTPAIFTYGRKTYTVPSGKAWEIVCKMIRANAFDAHGLEMDKTPGHHFKRTHRVFFNQRMNHKGKIWWIMTT